ncbi:MAG: tRNA guanosine(34) transglycosylase Tgt [Patescibacteria group bacterium]
MAFRILKKSKKSRARVGALRTAHGMISTPAFMPIATRGVVKTLSAEDITSLNADIILANTYHLWQRPGLGVLRKYKGLHQYMRWRGPILTDSGGYQVFSLSKRRTISEQGVHFSSEIDGRSLFLSPEQAIDIQRAIGSDIMMVLDECPPYPTTLGYARTSMELTTRWALRALAHKKKRRIADQMVFGIVQGATFPELRSAHAQTLARMPFDGFAIGGLAVGEPAEQLYAMLEVTIPHLPDSRPHYLMGVGKPEQIVEAVRRGVDMFDCVIPTRNARHGLIYVWRTADLRGRFYDTIHISRARFAADTHPIDVQSSAITSRRYTRAYLRHLFTIGDPLALRLATLQNVSFYLELMRRVRGAIKRGRL